MVWDTAICCLDTGPGTKGLVQCIRLEARRSSVLCRCFCGWVIILWITGLQDNCGVSAGYDTGLEMF